MANTENEIIERIAMILDRLDELPDEEKFISPLHEQLEVLLHEYQIIRNQSKQHDLLARVAGNTSRQRPDR